MEYRLFHNGQDTILPDIIDVAEKHGIQLRKNGDRPEYNANCPFCGDTEHKLFLNSNKNVFHCYHGKCVGGGGVVKFLALLEGTTEFTAMESIKLQAREARGNEIAIPKPKHPAFHHPALKLGYIQFKALGIIGPSWYEYFKQNKEGKISLDYIKNQQDYIWEIWQDFVAEEKRNSLFLLYLGIFEGEYAKVLSMIEKREQELGISLLNTLLKECSNPFPTKWVLRTKNEAMQFYRKNVLATVS